MIEINISENLHLVFYLLVVFHIMFAIFTQWDWKRSFGEYRQRHLIINLAIATLWIIAGTNIQYGWLIIK